MRGRIMRIGGVIDVFIYNFLKKFARLIVSGKVMAAGQTRFSDPSERFNVKIDAQWRQGE